MYFVCRLGTFSALGGFVIFCALAMLTKNRDAIATAIKRKGTNVKDMKIKYHT
jgi:hypothetical protein